MSNTSENLMVCEAVMNLILQNRAETGDPTLGEAIERTVMDLQFKELEADILEDPGAIEPWLIRRRKPD